ncbi:SH3 domain-containing protein [Rugamonas apoptosis]|nr:SH3 domain-containing protein [Rugamonas apoptosis]
MAKLYGAGAFLAGLVLTLFLASVLTPRQWWRRPNARALLILVAGSWGLGSLILFLAPAPHTWARATSPDDHAAIPSIATAQGDRDATPSITPSDSDRDATSTGTPRPATAGQPFQTHRALHLRAAAGVNAPLLATVPPGATVTPTGARDGDWWQVRAVMADGGSVGWVSSLWLRRSGE